MKKRCISLLLALCMALALLPATVSAAGPNWPYDFSNFDFSGFDLSDFDLSDFDLSDFDFSDFGDWEKRVEEALKEQERLEAEEAEREAQKAAEEAARQEAARQEEAAWQATSGVVTIDAPRTIAELNAMWKMLKPIHTSGSPYDVVPNTKPEQGRDPTVGEVTYDVMYDGLNTLNFARYMAGLTGDVSLVYDFIVSAQYGSVLLAFLDYGLEHTPAKPTGLYRISSSFYEKGYEGTSNSNLHMSTNSRQESTAISDSVKGYLSDLGENNRNEAGHRYYCLDPNMTGTGFGLATSRSGQLYSAMWAGYGKTLNGTGTKTTDYEAITWPAAGYHATDFYRSGMQWSVRLNLNLYDKSRLSEVKVTVTGPNGASAVVPHVISPDKMVIFTPTENVKAGEKYTVEISGLYRKDRTATLKYSVEFFNLKEPGTSTADLMAIDKLAADHAVKEFSEVATNYTTPETLLSCIWAETKYIDSLEWVSEPTITKATDSKSGSFKGTLKSVLNGESRTFDVKMSIPESAADKSADIALAAAKTVTASTATTKEEVERTINTGLENGWTASITDFEIVAPTATETGLVYYEFTVRNGSGAHYEASIVQVIPVLGRKALKSDSADSQKPPKTADELGLKTSSWAKANVNKAIAAGLYDEALGKDLTASITRAQAAAVAVKIYLAMGGQDVAVGANPFSDTDDPNVLKAAALGIVSGSGGRFNPNGTFNREEVAVILGKVYKKLGGDIPSASSTIFADNASISSWARGEVAFMNGKGIIKGDGTNFSPKGYITGEAMLMLGIGVMEGLKVN